MKACEKQGCENHATIAITTLEEDAVVVKYCSVHAFEFMRDVVVKTIVK